LVSVIVSGRRFGIYQGRIRLIRKLPIFLAATRSDVPEIAISGGRSARLKIDDD